MDDSKGVRNEAGEARDESGGVREYGSETRG